MSNDTLSKVIAHWPLAFYLFNLGAIVKLQIKVWVGSLWPLLPYVLGCQVAVTSQYEKIFLSVLKRLQQPVLNSNTAILVRRSNSVSAEDFNAGCSPTRLIYQKIRSDYKVVVGWLSYPNINEYIFGLHITVPSQGYDSHLQTAIQYSYSHLSRHFHFLRSHWCRMFSNMIFSLCVIETLPYITST